jgi:hypothetical protein
LARAPGLEVTVEVVAAREAEEVAVVVQRQLRAAIRRLQYPLQQPEGQLPG